MRTVLAEGGATLNLAAWVIQARCGAATQVLVAEYLHSGHIDAASVLAHIANVVTRSTASTRCIKLSSTKQSLQARFLDRALRLRRDRRRKGQGHHIVEH